MLKASELYLKKCNLHLLEFMFYCSIAYTVMCSYCHLLPADFFFLLFFVVELPVLDNEMYHAVKPGLSAYKDRPEEVCMPV